MAEVGKAQIVVSIKDLTREDLADISKRINEATKERNIAIGLKTKSGASVAGGGATSETQAIRGGENAALDRAIRLREALDKAEVQLAIRGNSEVFAKDADVFKKRVEKLKIGLQDAEKSLAFARLQKPVAGGSANPVLSTQLPNAASGAKPSVSESSNEDALLSQAKSAIKMGAAVKIAEAGFRGINQAMTDYKKAIDEGASKSDALQIAAAAGGRKLLESLPLIGGLLDAVVDFVVIVEGSQANAEKLQREMDARNAKLKQAADKRKEVGTASDAVTSSVAIENANFGKSDADIRIAELSRREEENFKKVTEAFTVNGRLIEEGQEKLNAASAEFYKRRQQILEEAGKAEAEKQKKLFDANKAFLAQIDSLKFSPAEEGELPDVSKFKDRIDNLNKLLEDAKKQVEDGLLSEFALPAINDRLKNKAKEASATLMDALSKGLQDGVKATAVRIGEIERDTASRLLSQNSTIAQNAAKLGQSQAPGSGAIDTAMAQAEIDKQALLAKFSAENEAIRNEFKAKFDAASRLDNVSGTNANTAGVNKELQDLTFSIQANRKAQLQQAENTITIAKQEREIQIKSLEDDIKLRRKAIEDQAEAIKISGGGFSNQSASQAFLKNNMAADKQLEESKKATEELRKINTNLTNLKAGKFI